MSPKSSSPFRARNRLSNLREASLDRSLVVSGRSSSTSPHQLYKYPARFSPRFASSALELISEPGDLVLDPFLGSGTTLIEAIRHGRHAVGIDVSPVSSFLTRSLLSNSRSRDLNQAFAWFRQRLYRYSSNVDRLEIPDSLPQSNLDKKRSWRHLRLIGALCTFDGAVSATRERLSRQVVLKSSQWAFDIKTDLPSFRDFVSHLEETAVETVVTHQAFAEFMQEEWGSSWRQISSRVLEGDASLVLSSKMFGTKKVDAIVTSPPYPGVHVLYGRWQVYGRRETDLPLWIVGSAKRLPEGAYTMNSRREQNNDTYFNSLYRVMRSARARLKDRRYMVQMVGFNNPTKQLRKYLDCMSKAGFRELTSKTLSSSRDGRLWRRVPSRRWYAEASSGKIGTAEEVVLIFRADR